MCTYWSFFVALVLGLGVPLATADPTDGIHGLADRVLKGHGGSFEFVLSEDNEKPSRWNKPVNDYYNVAASKSGKIRIEGSSKSALARGLRHYATEVLHIDNFQFVESSKEAPNTLPLPVHPLNGSSTVPWRYNLNTVTFSYTFVWYDWQDWERFLDWAAWRGVNIQLAWVGYEKIFLDSFRDLGMTDDEILSFFSGPAFQAWNRFGNVQGSWGGVGNLTMGWIDGQFDLQKRIVARMVELGITPVLPAFPGFVPKAISRVRPDANTTLAPIWSGVADENTQVTFLSPLGKTSAEIQNLFISKQMEAFGNVTNFYTLDQFNEISPGSEDTGYLGDISRATYKALTDTNPAAVWLLQGWLFYNNQTYWTQERIDAYLGGVEEENAMLILDLFSENEPQWKRTESYSGKPWIWCQLHDFGGNMALYGQATDITVEPIKALKESESLVGFGLTPEGFEGNEVTYDLTLDLVWSKTPIDLPRYFHDWATRRYAGRDSVPDELYQAWGLLGARVYDNHDKTIPNTGVSIYEISPALSGLVNRTGHYPPPTKLHYNPDALKEVQGLFTKAVLKCPRLLEIPAFQLDYVDILRQVMSNSFIDMYIDLVETFNNSITASNKQSTAKEVKSKGHKLLSFLKLNDFILSTNKHFTLEKWLDDARRWAPDAASEELVSFSARSQVTVWNWDVETLDDYAAKAWSGLIGSYYLKRWEIFVDELVEAVPKGGFDEEALHKKIRSFERSWQYGGFEVEKLFQSTTLDESVYLAMREWPEVFHA